MGIDLSLDPRLPFRSACNSGATIAEDLCRVSGSKRYRTAPNSWTIGTFNRNRPARSNGSMFVDNTCASSAIELSEISALYSAYATGRKLAAAASANFACSQPSLCRNTNKRWTLIEADRVEIFFAPELLLLRSSQTCMLINTCQRCCNYLIFRLATSRDRQNSLNRLGGSSVLDCWWPGCHATERRRESRHSRDPGCQWERPPGFELRFCRNMRLRVFVNGRWRGMVAQGPIELLSLRLAHGSVELDQTV